MGTSSAVRQFVTWAPLAAMLIVILPALAAAQEPVKSFDQLNTRLKPGDTVWVTDAQGREVKGRITSFAPDSMGIDGDGARTLRADDVRLVQTRRPDGLVNGTLIGFAVGAVGLEAANLALTSQGDCPGGCQAAIVLFGGAIGAGVGAGVGTLIGAFMPRTRNLYRAPGSARLSVAPVITPRTKGVAVAYYF